MAICANGDEDFLHEAGGGLAFHKIVKKSMIMIVYLIRELLTVGGGRVLVGSAVFKTVSRALVPFWVGSIPMHLRQLDVVISKRIITKMDFIPSGKLS
jgi:hypothetical protein